MMDAKRQREVDVFVRIFSVALVVRSKFFKINCRDRRQPLSSSWQHSRKQAYHICILIDQYAEHCCYSLHSVVFDSLSGKSNNNKRMLTIKQGLSCRLVIAALLIIVVTTPIHQCLIVSAFTIPSSSSSLSARTILTTGSNVKFVSPQIVSSRGRRSKATEVCLTADVAAGSSDDDQASGGDTEEPLFESLGKGEIRDYKARLPYLKSDIADGINVQVCGIFELQNTVEFLTDSKTHKK